MYSFRGMWNDAKSKALKDRGPQEGHPVAQARPTMRPNTTSWRRRKSLDAARRSVPRRGRLPVPERGRETGKPRRGPRRGAPRRPPCSEAGHAVVRRRPRTAPLAASPPSPGRRSGQGEGEVIGLQLLSMQGDAVPFRRDDDAEGPFSLLQAMGVLCNTATPDDEAAVRRLRTAGRSRCTRALFAFNVDALRGQEECVTGPPRRPTRNCRRAPSPHRRDDRALSRSQRRSRSTRRLRATRGVPRPAVTLACGGECVEREGSGARAGRVGGGVNEAARGCVARRAVDPAVRVGRRRRRPRAARPASRRPRARPCRVVGGSAEPANPGRFSARATRLQPANGAPARRPRSRRGSRLRRHQVPRSAAAAAQPR